MKNINNIEKYIKNNVKKSLKIYMSDSTGGDNIKSVDFYSVLNSHFSLIPHHINDRANQMKQVKSSLNLKFVDNIDKRAILNNKRAGDERDGLVFKKINPNNLDQNIRPNSFDWTAEEFNRKIVDRMVKDEETRENGKNINNMFIV